MERRLSAVLAADMVCFSMLMEDDEVDTFQRQMALCVKLINPLFETFHERIVKEMGDGILVKFPRVVDAVQCTLAILRVRVDRKSHIQSEQRIQYRTGINLGDIVIDSDDNFGNGVYIAARLEQMAESGEICISGMVYDQFKSKDRIGYISLGEMEVKNISQTVRVYEVLTDLEGAKKVTGNKPSPVKLKNRPTPFKTSPQLLCSHLITYLAARKRSILPMAWQKRLLLTCRS